MAKNSSLGEQEVEDEIEKLKQSPYVKLARRANYLKTKRKHALYRLRSLEKVGKQLAKEGITMETLNQLILAEEEMDGEGDA